MSIIFLIFCTVAYGADPGNFIRQVKDPQDVSGIMENDRALSDGVRKTNATVATLPTHAGNNVWTGLSTFTANVSFSGNVSMSGGLTTSGTGSHTGTNSFNFKARQIEKWVHFVGTGTVVILSQEGVSSLIDEGTADYSIGFSTPYSSHESYACSCMTTHTAEFSWCSGGTVTQSSGTIRIHSFNNAGTQIDVDRVMLKCMGI